MKNTRYLSLCRVHASLVARRALLHAQVHAQAAFLQVATRPARSSRQPNQLRHRPLTAAPNRHVLGELRSKPAVITRAMMDACGDTELAYKMIAERDNETVKIERTSSFVIVAKARIWASEGWQVVITDADGKSYALSEFDQLLAA
jgi:hypothetical protein